MKGKTQGTEHWTGGSATSVHLSRELNRLNGHVMSQVFRGGLGTQLNTAQTPPRQRRPEENPSHGLLTLGNPSRFCKQHK